MDEYWKDLISTALRSLQECNNYDAIFVIKNSTLSIECGYHDNWNGGIDYWNVFFKMKYKSYNTISERKKSIENDILSSLARFHTDDSNPIDSVKIIPLVERYIDWQAALPLTKESTIQMIEAEKELLAAVATGKSFKEEGVEEEYQNRHKSIIEIASKAGFDYPITCDSLAEWWVQIKGTGGYSERRAYTSKIFAPLLKQLRESDDSSEVNFNQISARSNVVQKALEDATVFLRDGRYGSAVDRIHTAFYGYLRQLLTDRHISFNKEDSLPSLYNKLHNDYSATIQPPDVADRIKTIMRGGTGIVASVNELRNNNTIAHPNGRLIQEREAQLVIRLVNAIVDYIESIEKIR